MTEQNDKTDFDLTQDAAVPTAPDAQPGISRRALLRGGTLAAPAILTLNSNAAVGWAMTSAATIGTRTPDGTGGDATCLIGGEQVDPYTKPGVYYADSGEFWEVDGSLRYSLTADGSQIVPADFVCQQTEPLYVSSDGGLTWSAEPVPPPRVYGTAGNVQDAAVVSFTALAASSFNAGDAPLWPHV